jgi:peroxiredoxin
LLSDEHSEYAQACHIAYEMDDVLRPFFPLVPEANGNDDWILPIPATYAVDTAGTIVYSFVETDYTQRAEPADILRVLPPLQLTHLTTLRDALDYEGTVLRDQDPSLWRTISSEIRALQGAGVVDSALGVGEKAPAFQLQSSNGGVLFDSTKVLKRGRPLIVTFYHGYWSSLCRIALTALQQQLESYAAKGRAQVVAISPESPLPAGDDKCLLLSHIKFPLLYDKGNKVAKQFRIKYHMDTELPGNINSQQPWPLPLPATYIIDTNGIIVYAFVDCDHTKRAEPSEILEALPARKRSYASNQTRGPFSLRLRGWLPAKKTKTGDY